MLKQQPRKSSTSFNDFDALKITLASPDQIREWSHGEVTKAETINYRTYKAEPEGLFSEAIFGPTKNYECFCGKYKKIRYKGIVCDKCGVEVTRKEVRRERMGHIDLVVPVTHVWFAYGIPNKMSIVLDMSHKKMLSVVYYTRYMVIEIEEDKRSEMITKLDALLEEERAQLAKDLDEELKIVEDEFKEQVKAVDAKAKGKGKEDFQKSQIEHKLKQSLAKVRREFAEREETLESFYARLLKLINEIGVGSIITEDEYVDLDDRELLFFEAKMGAEAIEKLLGELDLGKAIKELRREIKNTKAKGKKVKMIRRLQYLEGFHTNNIDPRWMIMKVLPVIPPELRPIIPLPGGKFATSDLNDLYRRIINRNNRLKRLIEIGAPEVILRNEKRMLQESADALFDNSHRPSKPMLNSKRLPYRSLTDELRGKKGIFRRNLLGKRVDYSGRAVIVGDAQLKIDECGLPKSIALEMFKPFVIHELLERELAPNIRMAKDMIEMEEDIVWDVLEEVLDGRPVLLNRAPTLHKYSIQAYYPVLVSGEAIHLHPLACKAFNADFDGDQMAVHVLLTEEAQAEGAEKMLASKNLVSIANGSVMASPTKDMLLGFYLMTDMYEVENPKSYGTFDAAINDYYLGSIKADEMIVVKGRGGVHTTTVGRVIFNNALPEDYPFVNERIGKKEVDNILEEIKDRYEPEILIDLLDELKYLGFKYATDLAFSFSMDDCAVNIDIASQIKEMERKDEQLQENYLQGLLTNEEKVSLSINMWNEFTDELAEEAWNSLDKNNAVYEMVTSGANGGQLQARQIMSIKGLIRNTTGDWIPLPIKGNYREGLSQFEYFVASTAGRKGVADSALRTASSGYLTRRLVDVAHDVIVRMEDCKYDGEGLRLRRGAERRISFEDTIEGRMLAQGAVGKDGKVAVNKGTVLTEEDIATLEKSGVSEVWLRSPVTCKAPHGICQSCYGNNIESGELIEMGAAAGVIAAQSIGEPGTQMTLRSFHFGGAMKKDITQGLPRAEELLEARTPKAEAEISSIDGKVKIETAEDGSAVILIVGTQDVLRNYIVSEAKKVVVEDGSKVKAGQVMYIDFEGNEKQVPYDGEIKLDNGILTIFGKVKAEETVSVLPGDDILVQDGQDVEAGTQLTEGSIDPKRLAEVASIQRAQEYVIENVQAVFAEQGVPIYDVHLEVIVRQMAKLGMVLESGDTDNLIGSLVNRFAAEAVNGRLRENNQPVALVSPKLLGIKATALKTDSFLSAMAFQEQVRVLTESAIVGKVDHLRGMKENVMIGRKIPSGEDARIEVEDLEMKAAQADGPSLEKLVSEDDVVKEAELEAAKEEEAPEVAQE